jgi:hypothetical protein
VESGNGIRNLGCLFVGGSDEGKVSKVLWMRWKLKLHCKLVCNDNKYWQSGYMVVTLPLSQSVSRFIGVLGSFRKWFNVDFWDGSTFVLLPLSCNAFEILV